MFRPNVAIIRFPSESMVVVLYRIGMGMSRWWDLSICDVCYMLCLRGTGGGVLWCALFWGVQLKYVCLQTDIDAYRMYMQGKRDGSATAAWLQTWNLTGRHANPPHATKFPTKLAYLYVYAVSMAYITPPAHNEAPRCFRRRICTTLHIMALALKGAWDFQIMTQHPAPCGPRCGVTYTQFGPLRTLNQSGLWSSMISYRQMTD